MKHSSPFVGLGNNHYDTFLLASVGEEKNGMTLSMLSALARQGLDPWDEAAKLNRMPQARAAQRLTSLMAECPIVSPHLQRAPALDGFVELLPRHARSSAATGDARVKANAHKSMRRFLYVVLFNLLLAGLILGSDWAVARFHTMSVNPFAASHSTLESSVPPASVAGQ